MARAVFEHPHLEPVDRCAHTLDVLNDPAAIWHGEQKIAAIFNAARQRDLGLQFERNYFFGRQQPL
jgi:hypothetical protein